MPAKRTPVHVISHHVFVCRSGKRHHISFSVPAPASAPAPSLYPHTAANTPTFPFHTLFHSCVHVPYRAGWHAHWPTHRPCEILCSGFTSSWLTDINHSPLATAARNTIVRATTTAMTATSEADPHLRGVTLLPHGTMTEMAVDTRSVVLPLPVITTGPRITSPSEHEALLRLASQPPTATTLLHSRRSHIYAAIKASEARQVVTAIGRPAADGVGHSSRRRHIHAISCILHGELAHPSNCLA